MKLSRDDGALPGREFAETVVDKVRQPAQAAKAGTRRAPLRWRHARWNARRREVFGVKKQRPDPLVGGTAISSDPMALPVAR